MAKNNDKTWPAVDLDQVRLLKAGRLERSDSSNVSLRDGLVFLKKFAAREKRLTALVAFLIVAQTMLELVLVTTGRRHLESSWPSSYLTALFAGAALGYGLVSYWAIRLEKTVIIKVINSLRAKWFKLFLTKRLKENNLQEKGGLIAKISYHLPLLSTGLSNSLFGAVRIVGLLLTLLAICLYWGPSFLWPFFVGVFGLAISGLAGYLVARRYIIQETTFYSKIIKTVDSAISDWKFVKNYRREQSIFSDFNRLVEYDSYFRVRRDIWLKFGSVILFIIILAAGFLTNTGSGSWGTFYSSISSDNKFAAIVISLYLSRLIYEGLRVGLYSIPFSLGLSLSIPPSSPGPWRKQRKASFGAIIFTSSKVRFFKAGKYYKDLSFRFEKGGRYLVRGDKRSGKTALAQMITGQADYLRRAWHISLDGKRHLYKEFFQSHTGFFYLDPGLSTGRSILEMATGKEKGAITDGDFTSVNNILKSEPVLAGVFFGISDWRSSAVRFQYGSLNSLIMQVIYCLKSRPALISVDNYWLDKDDREIDAILSILDRRLPDSVIVRFSSVRTGIVADYDI